MMTYSKKQYSEIHDICKAEAAKLQLLYISYYNEINLGKIIYDNAQKLMSILQESDAFLPLSEIDKINVAWTDLCLANPKHINNAEIFQIKAALTIIFESAKVGNFSFILDSLKNLVSRENPDIKINPLTKMIEQYFYVNFIKENVELACPVCGALLKEKEIDHNAHRIFCYKCESVSSVDAAEKTAKEGLQPSYNLFESFHNKWNPDGHYSYQYDIFISYRHKGENINVAQKLAEELKNRGLRTFFAPKSLWMENLLDKKGNWSTKWIYELEHALLTSSHFVVVLSKEFFESTHCELELRSIHEICNSNPSRSYWLKLLSCTKDQLPIEIREKSRENNCESLASEIHTRVTETGIELGIGPIKPKECFIPLPLNTGAWGEGGRFDPDPPLHQFESIVRELLVLSLRGIRRDEIDFVFPQTWQQHHIDAAFKELENLQAKNISPFPPSIYDKAKQIFKNMHNKENNSKPTNPVVSKNVDNTHGPKVYDPDKNNWYILNDYGGLGHPQDMDFECRVCKYREGVGSPNNAPDSCPNCGYKGN